MPWLRNRYFIFIVVFLGFVLDRFFKILILEREGFFVIKDFLKINFYPNWGIALSLPVSRFIVYPLIALILLIVFFFLYINYKKRNYFLIWGLSLIFVGAVSNLIDRIHYGYVVDYINFIGFFPVFNLADMMIIVGSGLILIKGLIIKQKGKSEK